MNTHSQAAQFVNLLPQWYRENHRDLPWRHTRDPYKIWLSEIILQQTRVVQGLPYYNAFLQAFPTVFDLASAEAEKVMRVWQGLGYYSRARNLKKCAEEVAFSRGGRFPEEYEELLQLPGVGPYTAAAIASFAFGKPTAVADGNVFRVLSRYFGLSEDISDARGVRFFREFAQSLLPERDSDDYNQAIMEFGAMQCKPGVPDCKSCILSDTCIALRKDLVSDLPVKTKKNQVKSVYFHYTVLRHENTMYMQKRTGGFWKDLYEFWRTDLDHRPVQTLLLSGIPNESEKKLELAQSVPYIHSLSHRSIESWFTVMDVDKRIKDKIGVTKFYSFEEIEKLPKPILIEKFIKEHLSAGR